jgi:hypothetical protein
MNKFKDPSEEIDTFFNAYKKLPPELQAVGDNMEFEKKVEEHPIPEGVGQTKVFGCETWDINSILIGNYWRRTIYTTDKLCKLFLKADLNQKKKYLRKKNPANFSFFWIMIIMFGVVVAIMLVMFLLPRLGGVLP